MSYHGKEFARTQVGNTAEDQAGRKSGFGRVGALRRPDAAARRPYQGRDQKLICAPKPSLALTAIGSASITCKVKLWRSGVFWSALSFVGSLGNFVCSSIIARNLNSN